MELTLEPIRPTRNKINGQFLKGHPSPLKGKKWDKWLSKEKQQSVLEALNANRLKTHPPRNNKPVMMIKDGKPVYFPSAYEAWKMTGISFKNINSCCRGKRKSAGGYQWYYYDSNKWITP